MVIVVIVGVVFVFFVVVVVFVFVVVVVVGGSVVADDVGVGWRLVVGCGLTPPPAPFWLHFGSRNR